MSVSAKIISRLDVNETITAPLASDAQVSHTGASTEKHIQAGTTVPASKVAAFTQALSAGAATIDLTSLTGTNGASVTFLGLKVQAAKFINPVGNAAMTITFGAANPYLLGGAAFKWILLAGQEILVFLNDASPDVASGAKDIDISGTGTQSLTCVLVAG
jgi:hypothetical protein